ncbi:MAG: hypothetical protein AB1646_00880 [Thermodesulfobacteriota bacterium]
MTKEVLWIHPATLTYRRDSPRRVMEALWVERRGWGYLRRRDVWIKVTDSVERLIAMGYEERSLPDSPGVVTCPYCGLYACGVAGAYVKKHLADCRGTDNGSALEEMLIDDIRLKRHHARILEAKLRAIQEQEEQERRERMDKAKEEALAAQASKDKKKRMKEETRQELRNRYKQ